MQIAERAKLFEDVAPKEARILLPDHRTYLEQGSGIDADVIEGRGYHSFSASQIYELVQLNALSPKALQARAWLGMPVYRPDGVKHGEIIRLFGLPNDQEYKYLWPMGAGMAPDMHPDLMPLIEDREVPVFITEGIKKADALLSVARKENFPCLVLSISGYNGWKTRLDDSTVTIPSPDLTEVVWDGRRVYTVVDSDCRTNDEVWRGWMDFTGYLSHKTGPHKTLFVPVPPKGRAKQGVDDYLLGGGKTLDSLLENAMTPRYAVQDASLAPAHLTSIGLDQLEQEAGERIPHLVASLIPEASITLVAGHTGTFKTWALLSMCIDGALGLPWMNHPRLKAETGPWTSLYINAEMSNKILGIRARLLRQHERYSGITDILKTLGERVKFVNEPSLDLAAQVGIERVEAAIIDTGAKVVVLDSLSMTWHGDENSASEVGALYAQLREVSKRTGVAWVIIHHLLKPTSGSRRKGDPLTAAVRGSGQLVQQADVVVLFGLKEQKAGLEGEKLIEMIHSKARTDVELPAWVAKFANPDGLLADLSYLGLVSETSHLFSKPTDTTDDGSPRSPASRKQWVLTVFRDTVPGMLPGTSGVSAKTLRTLLTVHWRETYGDQKVPSRSTLDKLLGQLLGEGYLTKQEDGKEQNYVLTPVAMAAADDDEQEEADDQSP